MRIAGRALFAAAVVLAAVLALVWLLPAIGGAFQQRLSPPRITDADRSIGYGLSDRPTTFVFSRPQQMVRVITNAELSRAAAFPRYGILVEAIGTDNQVVSNQRIYARSIQLFVRGARKHLVARTFMLPNEGARLSAGDIAVIDYGQPVAAVRLTVAESDPEVGGIFARVQEQRPVSPRQLAVGWDRISESEREELAAGSALPPALIGERAQRRLLLARWHPVGPAGVLGQDYDQVVLYERAGAVVASAAAAQ